jgi:hypothetical protein
MNDQRPRDDAPETDAERRNTNLILLAIVIVIIGGGLWLGGALLDARRADECMSSGRRNCEPISAPVQPRRQ